MNHSDGWISSYLSEVMVSWACIAPRSLLQTLSKEMNGVVIRSDPASYLNVASYPIL